MDSLGIHFSLPVFSLILPYLFTPQPLSLSGHLLEKKNWESFPSIILLSSGKFFFQEVLTSAETHRALHRLETILMCSHKVWILILCCTFNTSLLHVVTFCEYFWATLEVPNESLVIIFEFLIDLLIKT